MKSWKEYLLLLFYFFNLSTLYPEISDFNKSSLSFNNNPNDTVCAKNNLEFLYQLNSYEEAVSKAQQSVDSAYLSNDSTEIANRLLILGIMQENKGDNDEAFETFLKAYTIFKTTNNQIGSALSMDHLGTIFRYHGLKEKSLEYHTKAHEILQQGDHSFGFISVLNNLGIINRQLGNDDEALKYHRQAFDLAKKHNSSYLSSIYNSLGTYYWYQGLNDSALIYYKSALDITPENLPLKERHCAALNNIGNVYRDMHQYDSALHYYNLSIIESQLYQTKNLESVNLKNLGRLYTLTGNYGKAFIYFQKSLHLASGINLKKVMLENYYWLGELFEKQQDYKKALAYFKKYEELERVILAEKQLAEINQLEGDFLFEKSEKKRIIELNQKSEKNLVLQKKRTENAIFIALSIIFFITALFVFFQYQTKRKSNLKLLKLNEELERKVENRTTSHLEAKQKAEENRANITAIIEGTNNTIWAFNRNYEILYINHTMKEDFLKTFGVLLEPGMNLVKSLPEILQPTWKPRYDRVLANEQFTVEDAVPTEEGTVYIQVSFNPIIKNGEVIGGSCFGSDITKRKLSELQLIEAKQKAEESEEKLKLIANSFVDGMIYQVAMLDEDKRKFNYISDTVTRLYGCTPEQAMKDPDLVYGKLHPDDVGDLIRKEKEALKKMSVFRTECRVINPDGSIRWSYYVSQPRVINGVVCWDGIEVDISNQKKIENELKKAKDTSESIAGKLKAALRSMSDAVFISDIDGNFINFNDAFVSFHRFKNREECVKTLKEYPLFLDVYHTNEEFVPIEMWVVSKALRGESGSNKEYILKRKDTGERWFGSYNFSPIRNNEGEIVGSVVTARDITELKRVEQQLIKAKEKAEESDRLKSAFLANMSHEIRTPMNGILGFTNLLQQRDLSGENQQKYIDIIQKSGDRMLNTVNDIIDISRIEAGLESYTVSEVNVNEQLNYYYSFFKPEAEKKGVKLQLNNNIEEVSVIKTDMDKFNSVLTNLIKNAIKYTDKGIIEFGYKIKTEEDKTELVFYVLDTGIGIPEFRQQAVFDRFVQADIEDKQAKQGSGLGLAITKAYVEMMGGKIWLESEEGKGSTFYFSIDYNLVNKKSPVSKSDNKLPKNDGDLSGKLNILVVEDDEISLDFISIVIKDYARKIQSVVSGIDAISECKKNPDIDLILMDIQLPGMNGYETTKEIRKFNKDVIIIAQTAYAMAGDKEKALKAGCNDYISKPINQTELEILFKKYSKKI